MKSDWDDEPILPATYVSKEESTRAIGQLIADARNLSAEDLESIARYQREHQVRFGEAAISLGLANTEDVLQALSHQFNYAYTDVDRARLSPELVMVNEPYGAQAEALRGVRSQLLLRDQAAAGRKRAMAVVSPGSGDGKTFICANLGVALAQLGSRVLIIDADLRAARMHQVFNLDNQMGLSNVLAGRVSRGVVKPVTGIGNLFVLPVGAQPPNPLELIEGNAFGMLLHEVAVKFDHVLIDTPSTLFGVDSVVVSARCGQALVVERRNVGRVNQLKQLAGALQSAHADICGVLLNDF